MAEPEAELLNVYDPHGCVVGHRPRPEAKRSGLAVGAVNALVCNGAGLVLLQRRPIDKENGGLWDKTVGGHVAAGEEFDQTVCREAGEELFDDPASTRVTLATDAADFGRQVDAGAAHGGVVLRRAGLQLNLRDVRRAPGGELRNVLYHVASYLGRTELPLSAFRPQPSEIDELRYFPAAEVDALLAAGGLAPNMAFLWLVRGHELLGGAGAEARRRDVAPAGPAPGSPRRRNPVGGAGAEPHPFAAEAPAGPAPGSPRRRNPI